MIQIRRGEPPGSLSEAGKSASGDPAVNTRSAWRKDDVVEALRRDSHGKCMYCEAQMDDVSYGAVEHIRPKSRFKALELEWTNLGYCCTRCNTNKGAYWVETGDLRLLNPYEDAVGDHIDWAGPLAIAASGSSRGANTLRQLKFAGREDLLWSRARRIQELDVRIGQWEREEREDFRTVLAEDIDRALGPEAEFTAALRSFARLRGFPVRAN